MKVLDRIVMVVLWCVIIGVCFGAPVYGIILLDKVMCSDKWEDSGIDHKWGVVSGCLVQVNGKWIPEDNYREIGK